MRFLISNPGNEWGACLSDNCNHRSCNHDRQLAASNCSYCNQVLGYSRVLIADESGIYHERPCFRRHIREAEAIARFMGKSGRKNKQFNQPAAEYTAQELEALKFDDPPQMPPRPPNDMFDRWVERCDPGLFHNWYFEHVSEITDLPPAPTPLTPEEINDFKVFRTEVESARYRKATGRALSAKDLELLEIG